ncbi:MFS transporter [Candidatus Parcubacteria bacterium]|nr:MAG: MFS transporter [Candidatus Parcubacteria bacterium]
MLRHVREIFGAERSPIFVFGFIVLFWTMADSVGQYIAPLMIQNQGFSNTVIGFILGFSSIAGAFFDFWAGKIFKNTDFRRIFLVMFALCSIYPLLLWSANTITLFLFAMAIWGVYFDLYGFGTFDFIGRYSNKDTHASNFGIAQMFRALGQLLAPLIVGFVIVEGIDWRSFGLYWLFLLIAFAFLLVLFLMYHKRSPQKEVIKPRRRHFFIELRLWRKMGWHMMPILFVTFYLWSIDAFFWTLSPLYPGAVGLPAQFGGFMLAAFVFPVLIVGWFVGSLTKRFGKKRTAIVSLLAGSAVLSFFTLAPNPFLGLLVVLLASFFTSVALPSINSWFTGYIYDVPALEGETEGLADLAQNTAYIFGPFFAGVLADVVGIASAFTILGLVGFLAAAVLLFLTPNKIFIPVKKSEI